MNFIRSFAGAILAACSLLVGFFAVVSGYIAFTLDRTIENGRQIDESFKRSSTFINRFVESNGHLPSKADFDAWTASEAMRSHGRNIKMIEPQSLPEHVIRQFGQGKPDAYALSLWRGEWTEYYVPWTHSSTVDSPRALYTSFGGIFLLSAVASPVLWVFSRRCRSAGRKNS